MYIASLQFSSLCVISYIGNGNFNIISVVHCLVPGTVDNVTATVVDHGTIYVTWRPPNKPNGKIKEYKVIYNTSDGSSSGSAITSGDKLSIHNLTPNTAYFIFVMAKTSKGFGKKGTAATVRTRKYSGNH